MTEFNDEVTIPEPEAPDKKAPNLKQWEEDYDKQSWIGRSTRERLPGGGNNPGRSS
jgi:hypothetical protein